MFLLQRYKAKHDQVILEYHNCSYSADIPFRGGKGRLMYRSTDQTLMKRLFYPWQVNGVVGALVGALEYVPVREDDQAMSRKQLMFSEVLL
jgi:hypothetical protein